MVLQTSKTIATLWTDSEILCLHQWVNIPQITSPVIKGPHLINMIKIVITDGTVANAVSQMNVAIMRRVLEKGHVSHETLTIVTKIAVVVTAGTVETGEIMIGTQKKVHIKDHHSVKDQDHLVQEQDQLPGPDHELLYHIDHGHLIDHGHPSIQDHLYPGDLVHLSQCNLVPHDDLADLQNHIALVHLSLKDLSHLAHVDHGLPHTQLEGHPHLFADHELLVNRQDHQLQCRTHPVDQKSVNPFQLLNILRKRSQFKSQVSCCPLM